MLHSWFCSNLVFLQSYRNRLGYTDVINIIQCVELDSSCGWEGVLLARAAWYGKKKSYCGYVADTVISIWFTVSVKNPFCIMILISHWNHNGLTFADSPSNFLKLYFPVGAHYKSSFFKSSNISSRNWFICFLSNQVLETNASLCYFICSSGLKSDDFTDILLRVAPLRLLHNWLILQLCLNPDTKIMMWNAKIT